MLHTPHSTTGHRVRNIFRGWNSCFMRKIYSHFQQAWKNTKKQVNDSLRNQGKLPNLLFFGITINISARNSDQLSWSAVSLKNERAGGIRREHSTETGWSQGWKQRKSTTTWRYIYNSSSWNMTSLASWTVQWFFFMIVDRISQQRPATHECRTCLTWRG